VNSGLIFSVKVGLCTAKKDFDNRNYFGLRAIDFKATFL